MRHDCGVRPEDLGPFLLGQLGPQEQDRVAEAVAACPTCALQVEQLSPVAAALARVSIGPDEATPVAPPPALERVLASVRDEQAASRRRWRTRLGLAAAAAVLLVVGVAGALVARHDDPAGRELALSGTTSAAGSAVVSGRAWGTAVTLDLRGLQPGKTYGAWLADSNGDRLPAGTFHALADGTAQLELGASLKLDEASQMGVTLIGGSDVLTADLGT